MSGESTGFISFKRGKANKTEGHRAPIVFYNLITDRWISREYTYITFLKLVKCHKALKNHFLFILWNYY